MDSAEWLNARARERRSDERRSTPISLFGRRRQFQELHFPWPGLALDAQSHKHKMPEHPSPGGCNAAEHSERFVNATSQRANLRQREKDFRESLAGLSACVNKLQAEVEQVHSFPVFSVKIYKENDEIERLAKQVNSLAQG